MIGTTVGRYRIDSLLGEGGMGRVYKAFDTTLGRPAAVKVLGENLSGERLQRFLREARTASSLNHPNVVTIYEVGPLDDSGQFIAMELVEGETLREALSRGHLELMRAIDWVAQIADGIATAHNAGITHRDLKPENVVIARTGFAKILDFGLAKLREEPVDPTADTATAVMSTTPGVVLGTVGYMSPEQASGHEVDHRSDLFSIGCILYECLTGRRPFVGDSQIDTLHKIIYSEPAPLEERAPDTPRELQRIVRKLLAKDPEQRYQSAKDLALDLRDLRSEIGSHSRSRAVAAVERRKPPAWLAVAAAVVMAVLAFVIYRTKRDPAPPPTPPAAAAKAISMTRVTTSGNVIAAAISRNGEYIAYAYSEGGRHSIWLRQLASTSAIEIVPAAPVGVWGLRFAPDSRSIYYGLKTTDEPGGALYQIPILGGTPRKLLSGMESAATFSPDGKQLAFLRIHVPKPGDSSVVIANVDGTGLRTLITKSPPEHLAPLFFGEPDWSPDGKTIATPLRVDRQMKLIGIDTTTGAVRELSKDPWRTVLNAAWLPDGLAVLGQAEPASPAQLWLINPDGTRRRISNDLYDYRTLTATADGKSLLAVASETRTSIWRTTPEPNAPATRITRGRYDGLGGVAVNDDGTIFYSSFDTGSGDIYRAEPGVEPRLLTPGDANATGPSLSPDGKYIVFGLFSESKAVLARMNSRDGSDVRELCELSPAGGGPQRAGFTPDSQWVIFAAGPGTNQLWKVSIDGGQPVRVVDVDVRNPAVSPDGKLVAFSGRMIGVVPLDGGPPRRIENTNATSSSMVAWMPDGQSLLHSAGLNDRANLWLQPLDGSEPRQVTRFDTETMVRFDLSPNGKHLVLVRGLLERDALLITNFR